MRDDLDAERLADQVPGHRADGDPGGGLAGAGALEDRPGVGVAVLLHAGEIGVARAGPGQRGVAGLLGEELGVDRVGGHDRLPLRPLGVADPDGDRAAEREAVPHPAEDLDLVLLERHPRAAPVAEPPAGQLALDLGGGHLDAGRHALEHGDQRRARAIHPRSASRNTATVCHAGRRAHSVTRSHPVPTTLGSAHGHRSRGPSGRPVPASPRASDLGSAGAAADRRSGRARGRSRRGLSLPGRRPRSMPATVARRSWPYLSDSPAWNEIRPRSARGRRGRRGQARARPAAVSGSGAVERLAHGLGRRLHPGEEAELAERLGSRRSSPDRIAAAGARGRVGQRRGPRVVERVEQDRRRAPGDALVASGSATPFGTVEMTTSAVGRPRRASGHSVRISGRPRSAAAAASSSIANWRRATTVTDAGGQSRSPRPRRRGPCHRRRAPRSARRRRARLGAQQRHHADHVGVLRVPAAGPADQGVGRADRGRHRGDLRRHRQGRLLERHGQRQAGPLRAEAGDEAGQAGLVTFDRGVDQSVRPSAA